MHGLHTALTITRQSMTSLSDQEPPHLGGRQQEPWQPGYISTHTIDRYAQQRQQPVLQAGLDWLRHINQTCLGVGFGLQADNSVFGLLWHMCTQ